LEPRADQVLLIDADDTLWENSIYFERVIVAIGQMVEARGISAEHFRDNLNAREREHIRIHGYGTENFARSLVAAFEHCAPAGAGSDAARVRQMALDIMDHPVELLDGVSETLDYLHRRHELHLVTKGSPAEQLRKLESSGLAGFFGEVEVLQEKDPPAYAGLVSRHGWPSARTWMIGNSGRSDINPALAAGLSAVYIPHRHTWVLEHEVPAEHPRLLELRRFSDLRRHF
jgi:putative hydrolase of the HAD superfamily